MTSSAKLTDACFQFKASFSPCTILQLTRYDLDALANQLADTVRTAPSFFQGAPVIIELEKIKSAGILNFQKIKDLLLSYNMIPVGSRGGTAEQMQAATQAGLPLVNVGKTAPSHTAENKSTVTPSTQSKTLLIDKPIRSGMQVYAKQGDLIVTGAVSTGAEVMADGNIHVYGPLRGRALAGVLGNLNARIFCRNLEAELVAIAGYYLTKEDMQTHLKQDGLLQIYLKGEQVVIEPI